MTPHSTVRRQMPHCVAYTQSQKDNDTQIRLGQEAAVRIRARELAGNTGHTKADDDAAIHAGQEAAVRIRARELAGNTGHTKAEDEAAIRAGREAAVRVRAREQLQWHANGCHMHQPGNFSAAAVQQNASAIAATSLLLASPLGPALLWQDWALKIGLIR